MKKHNILQSPVVIKLLSMTDVCRVIYLFISIHKAIPAISDYHEPTFLNSLAQTVDSSISSDIAMINTICDL